MKIYPQYTQGSLRLQEGLPPLTCQWTADLRKRSTELRSTIEELFADLPKPHKRLLERSPLSPFANADVAAALLGRDLWIAPLAEFCDHLRHTGERPHLWTFEFGPSCRWDTRIWDALSLEARLVRSRAGALDTRLEKRISAHAIGMSPRDFLKGTRDLEAAAVARSSPARTAFEPIASPESFDVDANLVNLIAHWLLMIANRDRVLRDRVATGFEVWGYEEACSLCRERWGVRERSRELVPPFHPGCRCFAQPRFKW
jgi:hypothetical protein